jgi:hypothetical protein
MRQNILLATFCFLFCAFVVKAQTPPNAFNYSAVARNAAGQPIATTTIGVQISILKNSATGAVQYSENHFVNTDAFGLFNLVIGAGAVQSGSMATINWSNDNYYLKVGMDANGGTNFLTMGTTQLLSVPYAMHSATADSIANVNLSNLNQVFSVSRLGDTLFISSGNWVIIPGISLANADSIPDIEGVWLNSENCSITGTGSYSVLIAAISVEDFEISGFWQSFNNPVVAKVNGTTITIARQEPDNDNYFVVGTGTIVSPTQITLNYTISDENDPNNIVSDSCSSILTK